MFWPGFSRTVGTTETTSMGLGLFLLLRLFALPTISQLVACQSPDTSPSRRVHIAGPPLTDARLLIRRGPSFR